MSAFFLFENKEVTDPKALEQYARKVVDVVHRYDGSYRVLDGRPATVEGDWRPQYLVMIEFPSREQAQAWYESRDYRELKDLRHSAVACNGILMSGLDEPEPGFSADVHSSAQDGG